jgi:hypothetical protein
MTGWRGGCWGSIASREDRRPPNLSLAASDRNRCDARLTAVVPSEQDLRENRVGPHKHS